jgi:phosphoribosylaminoimidazole-succinocarboxamide synthase
MRKSEHNMSAQSVLAVNDDLPIRTDQPVHSGKVRSVYWLNREDSARLVSERDYPVAPEADLAVMVISDRLSAFDCIWHGEGGLAGVPGKARRLMRFPGFGSIALPIRGWLAATYWKDRIR